MQPLCIYCAGRFFTLFMRIRKSGAEFPLRHRFAYIFTLFFSIKSTFPIMGIYHSHRLQKRIYYHASHELHSTLFQVCRYPIGPFVGSFIALIQYFSVSKPAKIIIKAPLFLHNIPKYSCIRNTRPFSLFRTIELSEQSSAIFSSSYPQTLSRSNSS